MRWLNGINIEEGIELLATGDLIRRDLALKDAGEERRHKANSAKRND